VICSGVTAFALAMFLSDRIQPSYLLLNVIISLFAGLLGVIVAAFL
jgi:hypothetical protein